jgi:hypothetical protein
VLVALTPLLGLSSLPSLVLRRLLTCVATDPLPPLSVLCCRYFYQTHRRALYLATQKLHRSTAYSYPHTLPYLISRRCLLFSTPPRPSQYLGSPLPHRTHRTHRISEPPFQRGRQTISRTPSPSGVALLCFGMHVSIHFVSSISLFRGRWTIFSLDIIAFDHQSL